MSGQSDPFADPSIKEGENLIYSKEINFQIDYEGSEMERKPLIIKMITKRDDDDNLETVRFEISQQADIFFLYEVEYDVDSFDQLRNKEKLRTKFEEFPPTMEEILDKAAAGKDEYYVVFQSTRSGKYNLNICMPLKYKDVQIFSLEFHQSDEDLVRDQIQYRYNIVQFELRKTRIETSNFIDVLKLRDPSKYKAFKAANNKSKSERKSPRPETKSAKK